MGGWQFGGILTLQSGFPATPQDGSFDPPNLGGGLGYTPRPNATGISPDIANPGPSLWFNKAAFILQPVYTFGNAGRNVITGPGMQNVDLALVRSFRASDAARVQFRLDAYNAFNHPNFVAPPSLQNLADAPDFGALFIARSPRILQFGLKFLW